jgi:hypothetical protein
VLLFTSLVNLWTVLFYLLLIPHNCFSVVLFITTACARHRCWWLSPHFQGGVTYLKFYSLRFYLDRRGRHGRDVMGSGKRLSLDMTFAHCRYFFLPILLMPTAQISDMYGDCDFATGNQRSSANYYSTTSFAGLYRDRSVIFSIRFDPILTPRSEQPPSTSASTIGIGIHHPHRHPSSTSASIIHIGIHHPHRHRSADSVHRQQPHTPRPSLAIPPRRISISKINKMNFKSSSRAAESSHPHATRHP